MNKVKDLDLYKLLEVNFEADEAAIRKAYRKKALKCHPDKNPDDPKAAEIFHQVIQLCHWKVILVKKYSGSV